VVRDGTGVKENLHNGKKGSKCGIDKGSKGNRP